MSPEAVVRRLIEQGFNAGDLEVAAELTSPDLVEHQDFGPGHAPGAAGVRAVIASLKRAFPDFRLAIEDLVVAGDTAWLRMVATGTNARPVHGSPADGPPDPCAGVRRHPGRGRPHGRALGRAGPPRRAPAAWAQVTIRIAATITP